MLVRGERSSHLWLLCCTQGENQTIELSRCAGIITTELFYNAAHQQFQLAMIAQQLAQLQAAEDCLAERLAAPDHFASRGPLPSNFEFQTSHLSSGLPEMQSSESLLPSPLRREGEQGLG